MLVVKSVPTILITMTKQLRGGKVSFVSEFHLSGRRKVAEFTAARAAHRVVDITVANRN